MFFKRLLLVFGAFTYSSNKSLLRCVFVLSCLLLFSCRQVVYKTIDAPVDFSITSPKNGWTYYADTKIMLAVNVDTRDILWTSDISGNLGKGNHITIYLSEGLHCISAEIRGVKKEQYVQISNNSSASSSSSVLINYSPLDIMAKKGSYYSYSYSYNGTVSNFKISPIQTNPNPAAGLLFSPINSPEPPDSFIKDIWLPIPKMGQYTDSIRKRPLFVNDYNLGDKRSFYVINTQEQLGTPHYIEAELFYQSNLLAVWIPAEYQLSNAIIDECRLKVETHIIPRVQALWGEAADIDGDSRITLLFSNTINEEQLAIGFFNPSDFFERNTDAYSPAYNPASNEMDIIYVAIPDSAIDSPYSLENVIATIAHELTHASTFTAKTWNRIKNNETARREELFLDEGWSHLTENLCGLSVSGGNIKFLKRFFDNTSMYSFCGDNRMGQSDSAGMRGAVTLFLSWLFWEAGGMSWNSSDPVELIDLGGISFLKRMIELEETGWDSIGKAFGQPVDLLFNKMLNEINNYRISGDSYSYKIDPLTNEAVDFFVNMGNFDDINGTDIINIGFPAPSSAFDNNTLLSWSFVFYDMFVIPNDTFLILNNTANKGSVFFSYKITLK